MKKILITGGNGYVAKSLFSNLKDTYDVLTINRNNFDLSDGSATRKFFLDNDYFDVVIHTAITGGNRLKTDSYSVLDNNLMMYYNLLDNREHFDRFISVGSGAELYQSTTPYGLSKHVIRQSISEKDGFYNIRVFAVFDENEWNTRFIKANINRYINKLPIVIHQDKKMDFFYMKDFVKAINYYLTTVSPIKEFNCTYSTSSYLSEIAEKINSLSDYKVDIIIQNQIPAENYVGQETSVGIKYDGLDLGIFQTYKDILCRI